ncbi:uncharacterized protein BJX67DRAFT_236702 [Aspergillus lucknowensis]|uniref:Uncharacterized protein n=1 Tax=Aspergillus lucknowensis TaxID=176173 RepID=A0ABR4LJV4_9EURO
MRPHGEFQPGMGKNNLLHKRYGGPQLCRLLYTLLIKCSFENCRDALVSLPDMRLTVLPEIGYSGQIEVIDPRASNGVMTFAPILTREQEDGWEDTLALVTRALELSGADWRQVFAANRGYFNPTVVVKTPCATLNHPQTNHIHAQLADRGSDLRLWTPRVLGVCLVHIKKSLTEAK